MLTSYKFWYINRDDDGFVTEAAIRFYEGELTTKPEKVFLPNGSEAIQNVTRFRYETRLTADKVGYLNVNTKQEKTGKDCAVFTATHFGKIKTDDELRLFLNEQLAKDPIRTPISEQTIK